MNPPIHVNLFLRHEIRNPAPVRARVMVPLAALVTAVGCAVMAVLVRAAAVSELSEEHQLTGRKALLDAPHRTYTRLRAETDNARAGLMQLGYFRNARLAWGEVLTALPASVPPSVQFTEFKYAQPSQPRASPLAPLPAPTNRVETGTLELRGRTWESEGVTALLNALAQPPFTNLFADASVVPGAFRQEPGRADTTRPALLFELKIACRPRRFE